MQGAPKRNVIRGLGAEITVGQSVAQACLNRHILQRNTYCTILCILNNIVNIVHTARSYSIQPPTFLSTANVFFNGKRLLSTANVLSNGKRSFSTANVDLAKSLIS